MTQIDLLHANGELIVNKNKILALRIMQKMKKRNRRNDYRKKKKKKRN